LPAKILWEEEKQILLKVRFCLQKRIKGNIFRAPAKDLPAKILWEEEKQILLKVRFCLQKRIKGNICFDEVRDQKVVVLVYAKVFYITLHIIVIPPCVILARPRSGRTK
jgi:hypothetical protein